MLEKLDFITPTFMTVLYLFVKDPMQEYHEREVVRRAGVSKGSANKMLRILSGLGFLTGERKGRMVFYKLSVRDPVVRQFKVLISICMLKSLVDSLRQHSRKIILFGSCAEGTDVKQSDVDLLILTSEKDTVRRRIGRFNLNKEKKIAAIIVDANELAKVRREDKPLHENIERGIVLWETE